MDFLRFSNPYGFSPLAEALLHNPGYVALAAGGIWLCMVVIQIIDAKRL